MVCPTDDSVHTDPSNGRGPSTRPARCVLRRRWERGASRVRPAGTFQRIRWLRSRWSPCLSGEADQRRRAWANWARAYLSCFVSRCFCGATRRACRFSLRTCGAWVLVPGAVLISCPVCEADRAARVRAARRGALRKGALGGFDGLFALAPPSQPRRVLTVMHRRNHLRCLASAPFASPASNHESTIAIVHQVQCPS